jgi:hypothetical protein
VGSQPHRDPVAACDLVRRYLPEIPAWPQLPRRDPQESIYLQYGSGFPGMVREGDRSFVDRRRDLTPELEQLYQRYLGESDGTPGLTPECAAGFAHFLTLDFGGARAVKGQVIGPISWGLTVTDQDRRAILYDELLADAVGKHLRLQAAWQERQLRRLAPQTIMFLDEPYLASYGSAYVAVQREQVLSLIEEVLAGLQGLTGIHCCGNTDWSLLLETSADILNFDAYHHAETLALYPEALQTFLDRGGMLAWGIVPVDSDQAVRAETAESLVARLEEALARLAAKGVSGEVLRARSLLTPACGMGTLSEAAAEQALQLVAEVSTRMRARALSAWRT